MGGKNPDKELMLVQEMAMSNSVMVDVITRLLFKKGVCTEEEFSQMLKEVQDEYDAEKKQ